VNDRPDGGKDVAPADPAKEILDKLNPSIRPEKRREVARVITAVMQKVHSGPMPAPEDLEQYDRICPGAADRIIAMAQDNQLHRQGMERDHLQLEYRLQSRGQWLALAALLAMLLLVGFTFWVGQPIAASVLGGATILGVVGMFLGKDRSEVEDATPAPVRKSKTGGKRRKR